MSSGTRRYSNENWKTVYHSKSPKTTIHKFPVYECYSSNNPYEILGSKENINLHEFELSDDNIIFSTCSTLEEIFSTMIHMFPQWNKLSCLDNYKKSNPQGPKIITTETSHTHTNITKYERFQLNNACDHKKQHKKTSKKATYIKIN